MTATARLAAHRMAPAAPRAARARVRASRSRSPCSSSWGSRPAGRTPTSAACSLIADLRADPRRLQPGDARDQRAADGDGDLPRARRAQAPRARRRSRPGACSPPSSASTSSCGRRRGHRPRRGGPRVRRLPARTGWLRARVRADRRRPVRVRAVHRLRRPDRADGQRHRHASCGSRSCSSPACGLPRATMGDTLPRRSATGRRSARPWRRCRTRWRARSRARSTCSCCSPTRSCGARCWRLGSSAGSDAEHEGPRFEQWEHREAGVLGTLPFVLLAICLAVSFLIGEADTNAPLWVLSVVSVATAAWMLWWTVLHRDWRERPRLMVVYFAGLVPLMAALVIIAALVRVLHVHRLLLRRAAAGARVAGRRGAGRARHGHLAERRPARPAARGSIVIYALIVIVNVGVGERDHVLRVRRRAGTTSGERSSSRSWRRRCARTPALQAQLVAQAREAGVLDERQRDGARDPRHDRPGADRHHHPARGGRAGARRRRLAPAPRTPHAARAREPDRGAPVRRRRCGPSRWRTRGCPRRWRPRRARWSRAQRRPRRRHDDRRAAAAAPDDRGRRCCGPPRRRWPTSPSTPRAERVGLTLSYMDDVVTLDVRDDGVGFDVDGTASGHGDGGFGLLGMRQRVGLRRRHARDRVRAGRRDRDLRARAGHRRRRRRVTAEPDPAADRRRPPGRARRAQRHLRRATRASRSSARPPTARRRSTSRSALGPDVVLMDLRMPGMDGLGAIAEIARRGLAGPGAGAHDLRHRRRRAARDRGRRDRLPAQGRAARPSSLRAVRAAARGESVLSPSVASRVLGRVRRPSSDEPDDLSAARAGGPRARRPRHDEPGGGEAPVHQRGDGEDAPAPHLREARRQRPGRGGGGRVRPGVAHAEGSVTSGMSSRSMSTSTSQPTAFPPPGSSACQSKPNSRRSKFAHSWSPATSPKPAIRGAA